MHISAVKMQVWSYSVSMGCMYGGIYTLADGQIEGGAVGYAPNL